MSEYELYPEKPTLIEYQRKNNWSVTIFSIALFILVFSYFFKEKMNVILYLAGVLFIHEMGHYYGMKRFGYQNVRMLFIPILGAFVHGKKDRYSQRESLLMIAFGPLPGVFFGVISILLSQYLGSTELFLLGIIFLALNVLNLLPIDPLDGGQMLKFFFIKNTELFLLIFSFISSILMIVGGFLIDSMALTVFGFVMAFRVRSLQNSRELHKDFEQEGITYVQTYKELSNRDFSRIKSILLSRNNALRKYTEIAEQDELNELFAHQVNNSLVSPVANDTSLFFKISLILLWLLALASPIILFFVIDHNWLNYAIQNW